jgi:hypothetical protein
MKIGLIQTRGIGDIIIALPIAQYFIDQGHEVVWPIDARFVASFRGANPRVKFCPVTPNGRGPLGSTTYFVDEPQSILRVNACDTTYVLYSFLTGYRVANSELTRHLKFDEYKYAVTGVPFSEKWRLRIERDAEREERLFERVAPRGPYVLLHVEGSDASLATTAVRAAVGDLPVVSISQITDNIFDWLLVIERAERLVMIDSCFANLVEQIGITCPKHLWLRSPMPLTPVYRNGWSFLYPQNPTH